MLLTVALLFIFVGCVGVLYLEGMWGNAIRLVNVVTAALLAMNFFEPLASRLERSAPSYTFALDFLSLWLLFVVFMVIFRAATDMISRVKVRFLKIADQIGSAVLAALIGWVMVGFTLTTLHTAPLARNFLGAFKPESRMFFGLAPDRHWLGFMQIVSTGAYARTLAKDEVSKKRYGERQEDPEREKNLAVFDRNADFPLKYAMRRSRLEAHMQKPTTRSLRVTPGSL